MKLTDELKTAILDMPPKEKDKLLIRLIRKDKLLVEQLQFQLLGSPAEQLEMRQTIEERIIKFARAGYSWTPGLLMMEMRSFSGDITRYAKITKDALGEVVLSVLLLHHYLKENRAMLEGEAYRADKFAGYVVSKLKSTLKKATKLHPDLHLEFSDELTDLIRYLRVYAPTAQLMTPDLSWDT
ncbi:MAG: hypothetical protein ACFCUI_12585 [Bernardetiaceae bacterium]